MGAIPKVKMRQKTQTRQVYNEIGLNGRKNVKNILIYRRKNVILQSLFVQKNVINIYETAMRWKHS